MSGEFLRISAVVLVSLGLSVLIKTYRPEYSFLLAAAVSVVISAAVISKVFPSIKVLEGMYYQASGNKGNFAILLKALVIAYIAGLCGDTCRDYGQTALAQKVEFAGRCAIFILSLPLLTSILQTAMSFLDL